MSSSVATPGSGLIGELLKHQLGRAPTSTALQYGTHQLSWRKLDSRIRHAATGLRAAMVRPGDRIAVLSPNHPACIEALDRKSTRLNSSHCVTSRMPSSA